MWLTWSMAPSLLLPWLWYSINMSKQYGTLDSLKVMIAGVIFRGIQVTSSQLRVKGGVQRQMRTSTKYVISGIINWICRDDNVCNMNMEPVVHFSETITVLLRANNYNYCNNCGRPGRGPGLFGKFRLLRIEGRWSIFLRTSYFGFLEWNNLLLYEFTLDSLNGIISWFMSLLWIPWR